MDEESGAYVLFGSKPLCTAFLDSTPKKKENFWREPEEGWRAWEKIKKDFPVSQYMLIRKPLNISILDEGATHNLSLHFFIFANVIKTALVLAENYDFFRSFTGIDFHPLEIVFDLENPDSLFWNKFFDGNSKDERSSQEQRDATIALGLLFGFGKKNTLFFTWKGDMEGKEGKVAQFLKSLPYKGSLDFYKENSSLWSQIFREQGLNTFLIPGFLTFEDDDTLELYKKEREKIQAIYKRRDFLEVTIEQLCRKNYPNG